MGAVSRARLVVLIFGLIAMTPLTGFARPQVPVPTLELGVHSEKIVGFAATDRYILTASSDKTARLWSVSSGRLLRIFRLPTDGYLEGQAYAAAISRDERFALVAGFTRLHAATAGQWCVYVFNLSSNSSAPAFTIDELETPIVGLGFSLSGDTLVVTQAGTTGLVLIEWSALLRGLKGPRATLKAPNGSITALDFSPNGDLAISTDAGRLLQYHDGGRTGSPFSDINLDVPSRPVDVRYSPSGRKLAIGFSGVPTVAIIDLEHINQPAIALLQPMLPRQRMDSLDWDSSATSLLLTSEQVDSSHGLISRFDPDRPDKLVTLAQASRPIIGIKRVHNDQYVFAAASADVGLVSGDGRTLWRHDPRVVRFSGYADSFIVNANATIISIRGSRDSKSRIDISPLSRPDNIVRIVKTDGSTSTAPVDHKPAAWGLSLGGDGESLAIFGRPVLLDLNERVTCQSLAPDALSIYVGTLWAVYRLRMDGSSQWAAPTRFSSAVEALGASADGSWIVVWLADGTVRWLRASDGQERLVALVVDSGKEWVLWTPSGYYVSSPAGDTLFGWTLNPSTTGAGMGGVRFYSASQFERALYRPDRIRDFMRSSGSTTPDETDAAANTFSISQLADNLPPEVTLSLHSIPSHESALHLGVTVDATGTDALPITGWNIFLNGLPFVAGNDPARALSPADGLHMKRTIELLPAGGVNQLRVEVTNRESVAIAEQPFEAQTDRKLQPGDLYIAAVGVSVFEDTAVPKLTYASGDAIAVANTLTNLAKTRYSTVHSLVLSDTAGARALKHNIVEQLGPFLANARGDDTVVVFLSSHGLSDNRGEYFFVPADGKMTDWQAALSGESPGDSLINWRYFADLLGQTAGRRLLVVDTCASAQIKGGFDVYSLAKRSMASNFALLTAAKENEQSQELPSLGHGVFTAGWLKAFESHYDPDGNGITDLEESFEYAFDFVQSEHVAARGTQTPQLIAPDVLRQMALVGVAP